VGLADLAAGRPAGARGQAVRAGQGQVHADGENGAVPQGAQRAVAVDARADSAALRGTGLIALTHVSSRSVEFRDLKNLARVDVGRLPDDIRNQGGATAWRFISADYGATMSIAAVEPRISVTQKWALGVQADTLQLKGLLWYHIERQRPVPGVDEFPRTVGDRLGHAADVVEDHQLAGKATARKLSILLTAGNARRFHRRGRSADAATGARRAGGVCAAAADAQNLLTYSGQLWLLLSDQIKAEATVSRFWASGCGSTNATGASGAGRGIRRCDLDGEIAEHFPLEQNAQLPRVALAGSWWSSTTSAGCDRDDLPRFGKFIDTWNRPLRSMWYHSRPLSCSVSAWTPSAHFCVTLIRGRRPRWTSFAP